jgi:hypothetical protein
MSGREEDLRMLRELLDEHAGELREGESEAFADMLRSLEDFRQLTEKQRAWAKSALERFVPTYENLVSSGKVPRGREVELMVRDKPLRPPRKVVP